MLLCVSTRRRRNAGAQRAVDSGTYRLSWTLHCCTFLCGYAQALFALCQEHPTSDIGEASLLGSHILEMIINSSTNMLSRLERSSLIR